MSDEKKSKRDTTKKIQWFITYPQCTDCKKNDFHLYFPPSTYVKTCQEEHEDGGQHLHMFIKLKKGLTKKQMSTWVQNKFPDAFKRIDYKPVRNLSATLDYIKKEDPVPFEMGQLTDKKYPKGWDANKYKRVEKLAIEGLKSSGLCLPLYHTWDIREGHPNTCKECINYKRCYCKDVSGTCDNCINWALACEEYEQSRQ